MVLPCYVLDNWKNHARNEMAEHVELVTAYRLPDTLFTGARVTVDIAVFRKVKNPSKKWVEAKIIELANQKQFFMSGYFVKNPDHIIGKLDSYSMYLHTEKRERTGLKCVGSMGGVIEKMPKHIEKLKRRYTATSKAPVPEAAPVKKEVAAELVSATGKHEQVVLLVGRIKAMLQELETCLA